jgi:RNA polymerase sigma-70 factor (ECF subfamily)
MAKARTDDLPTPYGLLGRLRDWDDQQSWQTFYDTYWKWIFGVAHKSGLSEAEAQDVVQETLLTLVKQMKDWRQDPALGSFRSWLFQIVRWRIKDQLRKRLPVQPSIQHASGEAPRTATIERIPDSDLGLERILEEDYEANMLDAALERVRRRVNARGRKTSAKDFQIFEASVVKGYSRDEIQRSLGVSAWQVYTARSRLGKMLEEEIETLRARHF